MYIYGLNLKIEASSEGWYVARQESVFNLGATISQNWLSWAVMSVLVSEVSVAWPLKTVLY